MSELINNISEAATGWHRHLVWIAVNVGYIRAEIPHLESKGEDVKDIVAWLNIWPYFQERISALELEAFAAARRAQSGEGDLQAIKVPLDKLNRVLLPWTANLESITKRFNQRKPGLAALLMNCCGGEILKASARFKEVLELFLFLLPCMDQTHDTEEEVVH